MTLEALKNTLPNKFLRFDKKGEEHYNTISAFIKSMRASQPDAALYYLARMIDSGEDPKFIARRMVVFASEDIGIAAPAALNLAVSTFMAVERKAFGGEVPEDCGGRTPTQDAVDVYRSLLATGKPRGIDDGVDRDELQHSVAQFPFLAAPARDYPR